VKDLGEIKKAAMDELERFRTEALEGILNAIERHNLTEEELAKKLDETCKELFKVVADIGRDKANYESVLRILSGKVDGILDVIRCLDILRAWAIQNPDVLIFEQKYKDRLEKDYWGSLLMISKVPFREILDIQIDSLAFYRRKLLAKKQSENIN